MRENYVVIAFVENRLELAKSNKENDFRYLQLQKLCRKLRVAAYIRFEN